MNADGGVYFRNSPVWGDARRVPGAGVYNGDRVELICGLMGEPYGPYANRWWSRVTNLTRPGAGTGWVNAHFIDDGMPASTPSPGESTCGGGSPNAPPLTAKSVFFWPDLPIPTTRPAGIYLHVADIDLPFSQWASGNCTSAPPLPLPIPAGVTTLAGWSNGRLGPVYFLKENPDRWSQISEVILFDPGSRSDMEGTTGCEQKLSPMVSQTLDRWLKSPGQHRLLILSGIRTEDWDYVFSHLGVTIGVGKAHFDGLWHYYFPDLWSEPWSVRSHAQVCDYDDLAHEAVLDDFFQIVKSTGMGVQGTGCPISSAVPLAGRDPVAWNP